MDRMAKDVHTNIEYIIVPKTEWDLLNKDLENLQDILKLQATELNVFKSNEYLTFERLQEETVIGQFVSWMRAKNLVDCPLTELKRRADFAAFLQIVLGGCEKARNEFIRRKVQQIASHGSGGALK